MKHLKRIDEAVGTILERRASAETLLKDVVKGDTTEIDGIALSKQMAQGFLDWLQYSAYGKKFGALPFYKLFSASFNWGLDRFVKGANTEVKGEFKELKAKAKSMKEANELNEGGYSSWFQGRQVMAPHYGNSPLHDKAKEMFSKDHYNKLSKKQKEEVLETFPLIKESVVEAKKINESNSSLNIANAAVLKADVPLSYARDYIDSLERMSKRDKKKFKEYDNFSEDDFIEDVEYNLANESKVTEARFVKSYDKRLDNAKTKEEVLKLYPKAEFFVGKSDHFFGELEPNLFFKSYYTKGQKEFNIKSVYSKKGSNYVHLYNKIGESVVNESSGSEERRIALRAIKSIAKYLNRDLRMSAQYLINAAEDVQRDIEKGKVK